MHCLHVNAATVQTDPDLKARRFSLALQVAPGVLVAVAVCCQLLGPATSSGLLGRMAQPVGTSAVSERKLFVTVVVEDRIWRVGVPIDLLPASNRLIATGATTASDQLLAELKKVTWYDSSKAAEQLYRVKLKPRPPQSLSKGQPQPPAETLVTPEKISVWLYQVDFQTSTKSVQSTVIAHSSS